MALSRGYNTLTRDGVAQVARVSQGSINYHFKTISKLRNAVMRHAVQHECLEILLQGLANNHPAALKAPEALRKKAAVAFGAR